MAWSAPNFGASSSVVDQAISPDGTKIYAIVLISGTYSVKVITVSTGAVAATLTLTGCHTPRRVIFRPDGVMAYVVDYYGSVYPITVSSNTVGTALVLGTGGSGPAGVAVSPDSGTLAVINSPGYLYLISTASFTVSSSFPTGASLGGDVSLAVRDVALTNTTAYITASSNPGQPTGLIPVTIATGAPLPVITFGVGPAYVTLRPDGAELWVTQADDPYINVVSVATGTVTQTISSTHSSGIGKLVFNGNGTRAFGMNFALSAIYEYEVAGYSEIATTIAVLYIPTNFICLSPDSSTLYYNANNGTTASYVEQVTGIFSAPNAPTLGTPYLAEYAGVPCVAFPVTVSSADGENINGFGLRIKLGAGSYGYLNETALTISAVATVWNAASPSVASGAVLTAYVPTSLLSTGTYSWSVANQEAGANLQGSYTADASLVILGTVAVVATARSGVSGSHPPQIQLAVTTTGLAGVTTIALSLLRSDGLYVRNAGWPAGTSTAIVPAAQTVTVNDVEPVCGTAYTYTAFVSTTGTVGLVLPAVSNSATVGASSEMWLSDPTNPASALGFNLGQDWAPKIHEEGARWFPLGYSLSTKSTDGTKGYDGTLPIATTTVAGNLAAIALMENVGALFLQTPTRGAFYISWVPTDRTGSTKYPTMGSLANGSAIGPWDVSSAEYFQTERP